MFNSKIFCNILQFDRKSIKKLNNHPPDLLIIVNRPFI